MVYPILKKVKTEKFFSVLFIISVGQHCLKTREGVVSAVVSAALLSFVSFQAVGERGGRATFLLGARLLGHS